MKEIRKQRALSMNNTLKKKWNNFFPSDIESFKLINEVWIEIFGQSILRQMNSQTGYAQNVNWDIFNCCQLAFSFYKDSNTLLEENEEYF